MSSLRTKFFVASLLSLAVLLTAERASAIPLTFVDGGGDDQSFVAQITAGGGVTVSGQINFTLRGSLGTVLFNNPTVVPGNININPQFQPISLGVIDINRNPTGTGTLDLVTPPQSLQNAIVSSINADLLGGVPVAFVSNNFVFTGDGNVSGIPIIGSQDLDATVTAGLSGDINALGYQQTGGNMFNAPGNVTPGPAPTNFSTGYIIDAAGSAGNITGGLNADVSGNAVLDIGILGSFPFNFGTIASINESLNEAIPLLAGTGSITDLEPGIFAGPGRDIRTSINPAVPSFIPLTFNFAATSTEVLSTSLTNIDVAGTPFTAWMSGTLTFSLAVDITVEGLAIQLQDSTANALQVPVLTTNPGNGGTLQFGNILVGTNGVEALTVTNTGTDGSTISGNFPNAIGEFGPNAFQAFGPVAPGPGVSRNYTYTPTGRGTDSSNRTVTSNAGSSTVTFQGTGVAPLAAAAGGAVSTTGGFTLVGTTGQVTTSITNNGDGNLSGLGGISNLNGSASLGAGEFSLVGAPGFSIPDHSSINPVYDYNPTSRGVDVENLTHTFTNGNPNGTNTAINLGITVSGQGVAPLAAAAGGAVSAPGAFTLVGTTGQVTTSVTNNGDGNLSGLGAVSNLNGTLSGGAGEFSLVGPAGISIPDHTSINPVYDYNPTARGADVEILNHTFTNGNPDGTNTATNLNIVVTGQGVAPLSNPVDQSANNAGFILVGTSGTASVSMTNSGDGNLSGLGAVSNLNGTIDSPLGEFVLTNSVEPLGQVSIQDHTTHTYDYTYTPTSRGADVEAGNFNFINGSPDGMNNANVEGFQVEGQGVAPVQVTTHDDAPLTRVTYLTPGPGSTSPPSITVLNNGDGNLSGLGAVSNLNGSIDTGTDGQFTGGGAAFSLTDGSATNYAVNFQPLTRGAHSSVFTVNYTNGNDDNTNSAQVVQVQVDGVGVGPVFNGQVFDTSNAPIAGNTLDFGDVVIGGNGQLMLDITNITTDGNLGALTGLTLLSYTITGPDAVEFSLDGFTPGQVLQAGDLLNLLVNFDPLFPPGVKNATLTFLTDQDAVFGQAGLSFSFNLTGLAAPEPASVLGFALCTIGGVVAYRIRRRRS